MFNNVAKLHIFFETTKKIKRNLQVINELPQNQHFNNPIHLWQGGPIPQNMAKTFDDPPTLERSGSERRGGAVSSLFPEGERVGVRGGALFNGKEGRGDFRKSSTKGGYILLISRRVSVPCEGNRRGRKDLKKTEMSSFCYLQ